MSVFKVKLQQLPEQGYLDFDPSTACPASPAVPSCLGEPFTVSIQRTMYAYGPRLIWRKLNDGDTFTDCNYWKQFAFPQTDKQNAFIEVLVDDGAAYSDITQENTFPVVFGGDVPYTVMAADTFATNFIDILGTYNGFAKFTQIKNLGTASPAQDIKVQLNGSTSAVFMLAAGDTQIFNAGDLLVSALAFEGGATDTDIEVILSVSVECSS